MTSPIIVLRTEGGPDIGLGHVRRCVTLARELQTRGADVRFVVNGESQLIRYLEKLQFQAVGLDKDDSNDLRQTLKWVENWGAHGLIIDSYKINGRILERGGRPKIAVIDDLADRWLPVDLIINSTMDTPRHRYQALPRTRFLLGPRYVLLRKEFSETPSRKIRGTVDRLLITVGGSDPALLTPQLVVWSKEAIPSAALDVVVGPFFPSQAIQRLDQIAKEDSTIHLHVDPEDIRDLMLACDLALAGGGQTVYELAATGTPALAIRFADNQEGTLSALASRGTLLLAGNIHDLDLKTKVARGMSDLHTNRQLRESMNRSGLQLVDGQGTPRVAKEVLEVVGHDH
jgi:UDP-2,4-diacetamido-2,4,6-trideoxy-beta-L-altropyranose hydrolase